MVFLFFIVNAILFIINLYIYCYLCVDAIKIILE